MLFFGVFQNRGIGTVCLTTLAKNIMGHVVHPKVEPSSLSVVVK